MSSGIQRGSLVAGTNFAPGKLFTPVLCHSTPHSPAFNVIVSGYAMSYTMARAELLVTGRVLLPCHAVLCCAAKQSADLMPINDWQVGADMLSPGMRLLSLLKAFAICRA
jgi:hypothetical protein